MSTQGCQNLINSGKAWIFEGHVGRVCMQAIEEGACLLGNVPHKDYYGNRIPSRTEVKEGTKGSRGYVVDRMGEDHAKMLEGISDIFDPGSFIE